MRWYSGVRASRLRHHCTVQLRAVQAIRSFKNDNGYRVKRPCNSAGAFEFDCVIRRGGQYDFYECKYFDRPMTLEECRQEKAQLDKVKGIEVSGVGLICTRGFDFDDTKEPFAFIDGEGLYF